MAEVRIEEKPGFIIVGWKTWISGQDNEQFGRFWAEAHESGRIEALRAHRSGVPGPITNSVTFGVSCVEKNPDDRAFDFYIAAEQAGDAPSGAEIYSVPACRWAIFTGRGEMPMALVEAEMYAFMQWLPASGYRHANAPELEVYPSDGSVEFWLPVEHMEPRP